VPTAGDGLNVPAFDWEDGAAVVHSGPVTLRFAGTADVALRDGCAMADIDVHGGQTYGFSLTYTPTYGRDTAASVDARHTIRDTVEAWESWAALHRGYQGRYLVPVRRSALVLQGTDLPARRRGAGRRDHVASGEGRR
jgi:hypothetical protein